jgi:D-alanyl-lipoteichoic acid acyltransferase DltB (MBOAT superfamily)
MTNNNQGDRLLRGYLSSRLLLLLVGIITPVGILVVNAAAFVMRNLEQFRIGIAVCALISSLVLNGLTASWLLRLAGRRQIAVYMRHQEWAGVIATTVVVATSIGAAIFTYIGMGNPSHLPDILSVLTALAALLVPIGITYFSRIFANSR